MGPASRALGGSVVLPSPPLWRDVVALAKPRLSALVLVTCGVGMAMAPGRLGAARGVAVMLATSLAVAAANALNNIDERHSDARMRRTARRPLAAGRLAPQLARRGALAAASLGVAVLYLAGNPLTALQGFVALSVYAWVYTPMKRKSAWAVLVGALPGALPPLMGWTAVTGRCDAGGWALFMLLFAWQLPHFLAIATYLADDYARAGMQVLPLVWGIAATQRACIASAVALCGVAWGLTASGLGGLRFAGVAASLGAAFVGVCLAGRASAARWARRVFVASIVYLACLLAALVLGRAAA